MGIPPYQPFVTNSALYDSVKVASPIATCSAPKEGLKTVPMQFTFNAHASFFVDLTTGTIGPPMSQIAAIYMDASQCGHDVNIVFADTGFQVRCGAYNSVLAPVLCNSNNQKFYVTIVEPGTNSPATVNGTDIFNLFALNQFIPEFNASSFIHAEMYGWSEFFQLKPVFSQSKAYSTVANNAGAPSQIFPVTLLNAKDWFITALTIDGGINAAAPGVNGLTLSDNGNIFYQQIFQETPVGSTTIQKFVSLPGLNYRSTGFGPLTATLYGFPAGNAYLVTFNIFGGILTP